MDFFSILLACLVVLSAIFQYVARRWQLHATRATQSETSNEEKTIFRSFQWNYLVVYFIVMEADWLQGPYVYALYQVVYGFDKSTIAILFITGFSSSMIFGTFIGSIADKFGRKRMCQVFGIVYSLSCLTKLSPNFYVLLIGRLLAGIATSLLFSSFDSWMVFEHFKLGFSSQSLSETFSLATFGNGIVAIVAGLLASLVAEAYGFVAPFMLAIIFLSAATIIVTLTWSENYGDANIDISETFTNAVTNLKSDPKIMILGLIQSLFEGPMYVFVFMWTPSLQSGGENLPYGIIFACYMVCVMIGSSLFSILVSAGYKLQHIGVGLLSISALALSIPAFSSNHILILCAFLVFEVTCGAYWPCFGTLKGKYIPEDSRATIMNFFRVPVNLFVVVVLLKVSEFTHHQIFTTCSVCLFVALVLAHIFSKMTIHTVENADERKEELMK